VAAAVASSVVGRGGSLIVTATGPGSSEIPGVEVLVDGVVQCGTSPCKVASIAAGTHMVSVRAKGFNPTASLAVTVSARTEGVLNVTLSPAAAAAPAIPVAAAPAPPRPASAAPAQSVASKPVETRPAPAVPAAKAALGAAAQPRSTAGAAQTPATASATNAPASTDKGDSGTLRIVSLPVASVLLDGRPIGSTPQVVRVTPGQHRVAIVAGDDRRAQTVTVAPGATQIVSVRF